MRSTFCALSYKPRVKLLNNGNIVGLRFGFRTVQTLDYRVAGSNPAWGGILPEPRRHVIVQSLFMFAGYAFVSKVLIQRIACTCLKRTWQFICSILFISNILLNNPLLRMLIENCIFWTYFICTNCVVKGFDIQKPFVPTKKKRHIFCVYLLRQCFNTF